MNVDDITVSGDERAKIFCLEIMDKMVELFGIPPTEAIGRINRHWKGQKLYGPQMIYQRDAQFWANTIYYEADAFWWVEEWMAEHTPKPKPYP